MTSIAHAPSRWDAVREDVAKFPAFFRRDLLVLWSYRASFFSDWLNMLVQVLVFYFLNRLVPSDKLPTFNGRSTSYLEFVTVALVLTSVIQITLSRLVTAVRSEQLMGTLQSLLLTPTAPSALQMGSVAYDILYFPLRTSVFLTLMWALLDVHLHWAGLLPMFVIFLVFLPFMWGIGVASAAAVLTFRRGSNTFGIGITVLILGSGAYFPVQYFPGWLRTLSRLNPVTKAVDASREALLGGADWNVILSAVLRLVPFAVVSVLLGVIAFRLALRREHRRGTLDLY